MKGISYESPRNQFDVARRKRGTRELLRLGSNLAGGVGVSGGGSSGFDGDSGGEGRVGSGVGVVGFSSSAIEGSFRFLFPHNDAF